MAFQANAFQKSAFQQSHSRSFGQANALIDSPIHNVYGQAGAYVRLPAGYGQAQALVLYQINFTFPGENRADHGQTANVLTPGFRFDVHSSSDTVFVKLTTGLNDGGNIGVLGEPADNGPDTLNQWQNSPVTGTLYAFTNLSTARRFYVYSWSGGSYRSGLTGAGYLLYQYGSYTQGYGQARAYLIPPRGIAQAQAKIIVPANEYENVIFSQVPIGYWPLDETSGSTFANRTGNGDGSLLDAGTITFSINHTLANIVGNTGIQFSSGSLSRINASITGIKTATGSATTVTGWVKFNSGTNQMIFGWFVYDVYYQSGNLGFNTGGADLWGHSLTAGQWVHVAAVFYDNQAYTTANKLYINGVNQSMTQFSGSPTSRDVDSPLYFSGWGANGSEWARGTAMDAVSAFNRELTSAEILDQYNAGLPRGYGQAQANITRSIGYGQATALIDSPIKQAYGQAQTIVTRPFIGQAQAFIVSYEYYVINDGAVYYWRLNDTTGTTAVARFGGQNGTYKSSGITYDVYAPMAANEVYKSVTAEPSTFMNTNVSNTSKSNTFSFEVWYKTSESIVIPGSETTTGAYSGSTNGSTGGGTSPNNLWFPNQMGGSRGIGVSVGTNGIVVEAHGDFTLCAPAIYSGTISSTWHHLVITVSSKQPKIYLDGVLVRTGLTLTETVYRPTFLFGVDSYGPFRGSANNAALYDVALTDTQVSDHYNAGVPRGYGQAQALIATPFPSGQAQAYINHIGYMPGQAQAKLNSFDFNQYGQAQADIKVFNNNKVGQANALIKAQDGIVRIHLNSSGVNDGTYYDQRGPQQPNYDNTNNTGSLGSEGYAFTAAFNADETGTWSFRVSVDDGADFWISGTRIIDAGFLTRFAGEAQFDGTVSLTAGQTYTFLARFYQGGGPWAFRAYYKRPSDSVWYFLTDNNPPWIQIWANAGFGQANARIISIGRGYGQTQAQIGHLQYGQAQADILATNSRFGQAQAKLNAFDVPQCGQAQCQIASQYRFGQANADIKAANNAYGQALTFVGHFQWGQAQARLIAFNVNGCGQANVDITNTNRNFGLALAAIDHGGHGQANADIKQIVSATGNAFAYILPPTFWGQAQARIIAFNVNGFGQANADIHNTYYPTGFAKAQITKQQGFGITQTDIKSTRNWGFGQAKAFIGHFNSGQARVFIVKNWESGQAQADIKTKGIAFGQAQTQIYHKRGYAQVNADIITINYGFGQALAFIGAIWVSQAQADILRAYQLSGQAQGRIKAVLNAFGQAQAWIRVRHRESGQARVYVVGTYPRSGQAQVYIDHFKFAQAQARIYGINTVKVGQAQAYILANATVTPPGPTSEVASYLVNYNGEKLPGYAQSEDFDSSMRMETVNTAYIYKSLTEILGLSNKSINVTMRLWETTYAEVKKQAQKAATILRSNKGRFAKLYLGHYDKYYLAKTVDIKVEKTVGESMRILDYSVMFEAKPWLIDNTVRQISGTTTVSTDAVGRTIINGGWAPTRITVTGTDVTISGYTASESTGYIQISGAVNNLVLDAQEFTVYEGLNNRSNIITPLDGVIYVGPGKTTFDITGATDCTIEWQDRWYL